MKVLRLFLLFSLAIFCLSLTLFASGCGKSCKCKQPCCPCKPCPHRHKRPCKEKCKDDCCPRSNTPVMPRAMD